jgi:hypothetical protein
VTNQILRRPEKIEVSMAPRDDVPKIKITWIYVEACDGYPTGKVTVVRDGEETEEFRDPAQLRTCLR